MRPFLTLIATAAFSLHILLGCCWHHAHGANAPPGHVHTAQAYDHVHVQALVPEKHHHSGCQHQHESDDEQEHQGICTDPQCVFLHAGAVIFDLDSQVATLPVIVSDSLSERVMLTHRAQWDDRGKLPPDVPLYLAFAHLLN